MKNEFSYSMKLGKITICEEDRKITAISLNAKNYKNTEETEVIKKAHRQLVEYFEGKRKEFDLELNPKGTEFQKKIWKELLKIPYGKTASYQDIAKASGNIKACRAVGGANNKNPVMIVVPCHRVIGKNGDLTGYAGSIGVKEKLLNLEKSGISP